MMRTLNHCTSVTVALILCIGIGMSLIGCATSADINRLQVQVQKAFEKSEQALMEAQKANAAVVDASRQKEDALAAAARAEDAADRAERAADEAENHAQKAEAVFLKMMEK